MVAAASSGASSNRYNSSAAARGGAGRARWAVDLTEQRAAPTTFLTSGTSSQEVVPFGFSAGAMEYSKEVRRAPVPRERGRGSMHKRATSGNCRTANDAELSSFVLSCRSQDEKNPRDEAKQADLIYKVRVQEASKTSAGRLWEERS